MQINRSYFLIAAVLLFHLLFFLSSLVHPPTPLSDSRDYLNASLNLYKQGVLYCGDLSAPIVDEQFTRRPPLYPLILGIATFTKSNIPVQLLQVLLSLFSIYLVFKIFILMNEKGYIAGSNRIQAFGLLLLMTTPAQFIYASRIMTEIPFQLILVLMAWSVFQYYREVENQVHARDPYIWYFYIFLTLGMATKPVLYPFGLLAIFIALLLFLKEKKRVFLYAIIIPILWISLYSVWNYNRTGSAQYSSIQTANMVNYNLRYFLMGQKGSEAAVEFVDHLYEKCGMEINYQQKVHCLHSGVKDVIRDNPMRYGLFHFKGCVSYFLDPGRFDLATFFNIQQSDASGFLQSISRDGLSGAFVFLKKQGWGLILVLVFIALFKLVKISGFLLFLFRRNEQVQFRIFLALLVGYLAVVTGPLGASRFLLPVELLIIGGAVIGWAPILVKPGKDH